jgi:hypothetical protein
LASTSEVTFGARIANAEALSTNLKGFVVYVPPTTYTSIVNYDTLIASMKTENSTQQCSNNNLWLIKKNGRQQKQINMTTLEKEHNALKKQLNMVLVLQSIN